MIDKSSMKPCKTAAHVGLFVRSQDIAQRKRYVNLVDSVRENGGDVRIFSSLHVSGEREFFPLFFKPCSSLKGPEIDIYDLRERAFVLYNSTKVDNQFTSFLETS